MLDFWLKNTTKNELALKSPLKIAKAFPFEGFLYFAQISVIV
jgi:hypothetical protein